MTLIEQWIDRHSVNCYFCGRFFDEREGTNADEYNNNNGGSICPYCASWRIKLTPSPNELKEEST